MVKIGQLHFGSYLIILHFHLIAINWLTQTDRITMAASFGKKRKGSAWNRTHDLSCYDHFTATLPEDETKTQRYINCRHFNRNARFS